MNIVKMKIDDLKPAPYNPRIALEPGMPEYEKLKNSIEEFGFVETPVFNEFTGNIVGGHQRLTVAKALGYKEIEVSIVNISDPAKEKALNIALNKVDGLWDDDKLAELLKELDQGVSLLTGFDDKEINGLIEAFDYRLDTEIEIQDDDFDVDQALEEIKEPETKIGEVWLLGRHRLMCGDATEIKDVNKLMNGEWVDLIVTDPPYNVAYEGKTEDKLTIENDQMDDESFYKFLLDAFTNLFAISNAGTPIYIFHAASESYNFIKSIVDSGFLFKQTCIWKKNGFVLGRQDYHWEHEPVLYGWKPGAAHNWYADRKQTTIWEFNKPLRNGEHPTMKPLDLISYPIMNSSKKGDLIADFFGGSGSTLMSSEKLERTCYTMELDPKYCDVIKKRYEAETGIKPLLLTK